MHDCDFPLHGLARIADYYFRGDGSEATAAARNEGRTPRIHVFTDGCGKQYKGRRNFCFLADKCGKSVSTSTTTLRPRLTSRVTTMGSAASLRTP